LGAPEGRQRELNNIDAYKYDLGTYNDDGARYAEMLGGELVIWDDEQNRRY
jgi:hypothetical protein